MNELKMKYSHTQDKRFYMTGSMMAHIYSRIRTEKVYKGNPGDPLVDGSFMAVRIIRAMPVCSLEKFTITSGYSLDVLAVKMTKCKCMLSFERT